MLLLLFIIINSKDDDYSRSEYKILKKKMIYEKQNKNK